MEVVNKYIVGLPTELIEEISKKLEPGETVEAWIEKAIKAHTEYVPIEVAAKILHQSVSTLYRKAYERKIPSYKGGGTLLFKREELLAMIAKTKRHSIEELQAKAVAHMENR